jgi:hypothetical protein
MKPRFLIAFASSLLIGDGIARAQTAQAPTGTLTVDIVNFTSEIKLKPKIEKALKSGGLEWGVKDGLVLFSMVNKRFVNFDMPQFSRYATQTSVTVPAGDYAITGIGFIPTTSFSVDKMLAKGAFFNEQVIRFKIEAGRTTTLTIRPVIEKRTTLLIKFFQPELMASVTTAGGKSEEVNIVAKTDKSILWPDYSGPLKFKVQ